MNCGRGLTGEPRAVRPDGGFTVPIHGLEQRMDARGTVPGQTPATPQGCGFFWNRIDGVRGFIKGVGPGRAAGGGRWGAGDPGRNGDRA